MMKFSRFVFMTAASFLLFSCASTMKQTSNQVDQKETISPQITPQDENATSESDSDSARDAEETSEQELSDSSTQNASESNDSNTDSSTDDTQIYLEKLEEEEYLLEKLPDDSANGESLSSIKEPSFVNDKNQKSEGEISDELIPVIPNGKSTQTQPGIRKSLESSGEKKSGELSAKESEEDTPSQAKDESISKSDGKTAEESNEPDKTKGNLKETGEKNVSVKNEGFLTQTNAVSKKTDEKPDAKKETQTDENSSQTEKSGESSDGELSDSEAEAFKQPVVIVPSREVTVKKNQYLDVTYPGSGWVYIGENQQTPLFRYFGRKIGSDNTSFTLRSISSGSTLLHFYKNDALTGNYIDDYLQVFVTDEAADSSVKAVAPSYAEIVPAKPVRRSATVESKSYENKVQEDKKSLPQNQSAKKTEEKASSKEFTAQNQKAQPAETENDIKTVIQNTSSKSEAEKKNLSASTSSPQNQKKQSEQDEEFTKEVTENTADESLLDKAQKAYQEKNFHEALSLARQYLSFASSRIDEAMYLLGQIYESDSDLKNIRNAIDSYEAVVKRFPMRKFWKKANNRTVYLKRFYIDIR